jgi:predicted nicotinamide N-methyase
MLSTPTLAPYMRSGTACLDDLHLAPLALIPEIQLHLAEDAIVLQARLETAVGHAMPPPYWANAWAGGQALGRYVLEHRDLVAGRNVLDIASGSGLVAIAAALAGAATVTANDIDPYAQAAIDLNARANGVTIATSHLDILDGDGDDADVVLAGDAFYDGPMARRVLGFLERAAARGARVLVGDPGRDYLPREHLEVVATYEASRVGAAEDAEIRQIHILRLSR